MIKTLLTQEDVYLGDSALYAYLLEHDPDGQVYLDEEQAAEFEKEMGL